MMYVRLSWLVSLATFFLVMGLTTPHWSLAQGAGTAATPSSISGTLDQKSGIFLNKLYGYNATEKLPTVLSIIAYTVTLVLSLVGIGFLILMIYGGITWMTAQGNEEQVGKAQKMIRDAVIGLAVVLFAYLITYTIVSRFLYSAGLPAPTPQ